jgi:hypothetical protein
MNPMAKRAGFLPASRVRRSSAAEAASRGIASSRSCRPAGVSDVPAQPGVVDSVVLAAAQSVS